MKKPSVWSVKKLRELLNRASLRATPSRLAVLRHLLEAAVPQSHSELADLLEPEGFDRVTIYRNLIDLTEGGLLTRTDLGDHIWRFEPRREKSRNDRREHPHFVCNDCGSVSCLPELDVNVLTKPGFRKPALAEICEVVLKGRCVACLPAMASCRPR